MDTQEKTMEQICEELDFTLDVKESAHPLNARKWTQDMVAFYVTLGYKNRYMSTYFYMGKGLRRYPSVEDVVHSFASDHNILSTCSSVQEFASEFGLDEDTFETYELIKANAKQWEDLIGDSEVIELIGKVEY